MELIKLICPACGAGVSISDPKDIYKCEYCGSKFMLNKQAPDPNIQKQAKKIPKTYMGSSQITSIDKAFILLESRRFTEARECFDKALDNDPKLSRAYIGIFLCSLNYCSIEELKNHKYEPFIFGKMKTLEEMKQLDKVIARCSLSNTQKRLDQYKLFKKAVEYASTDEKKDYKELADAISTQLNEELEHIKATFAENNLPIQKNTKKQSIFRIIFNAYCEIFINIFPAFYRIAFPFIFLCLLMFLFVPSIISLNDPYDNSTYIFALILSSILIAVSIFIRYKCSKYSGNLLQRRLFEFYRLRMKAILDELDLINSILY